MGRTFTIRAAVGASLLALAACTSTADLEAARAQEQRAEDIIEDVQALPDSTPGKDELLADAVKAERLLEDQRKALEALTRDGLIGTGIDVGTRTARGDYTGAIEALLATLGAGAVVWLRRKQRADLDDLERRRDESRAAQGLAPNSAAQLPVYRTPQVAPPAGGTAPIAPVSAAPGFAPSPQSAPTPPAATFYGDTNRFPAAPVVSGPNA